ncbi:MAG: glucuronate isomerase [Bacteroidetes bacterium]|nr:glucuronate isomerase [Bacteroidota bacterium]
MKTFINDDFLLHSDQASRLYHDYAAELPILDYHNHISPERIAGNENFRNLTHAWLDNDHYKWRLMRAIGVDERFITGDAADVEKFEKWSYVVPFSVRNPLYHWTHLELMRYFGIGDLLGPLTGKAIYENASSVLQNPEYSTQALLRKMNVEVICSPSDPVADLSVHEKIKNHNIGVKVLPTWRPEKLFGIEHILSFNEYIDSLSEASDIHIVTLQDLVEALRKRHDYFAEHGCVVADHFIDTFYSMDYTLEDVQAIFAHSRLHKPLSWDEVYTFRSYMLREMAVMNHEKGWVQQYHFGAMRNNNSRMYNAMGPDKGWDSVGDQNVATRMTRFLDSLDGGNQLAKTILYNLNPSDNAVLASMLGNFNDGSIKGKIQFGSAWRFNNHKSGIEAHLNSISNMSLLSVLSGTQTDSHSFLSFPRHEYFRRVLCNLVGEDIRKGELPEDFDLLGKIVRDISYFNAKNYFNF